MKKNIIKLFAFGLLLMSTGSCKKFLDQKVLGNYESTNFFTSDANANNAINAAYPDLAFTDAASNAIWVLGDVASDDAIKGGNPGDQADFENIDMFNILPSNSAVEAVWKRYYDGVFKCNVVIDGITGNDAITPAVATSCLGQAKFLRAYYYFILTNCYGNIPLHLKVETPEELQSPAIPQAQIYAQIIADLNEAATALPVSQTDAGLGRPTKGAALALMAKTYLFSQNWDSAAIVAQQVDALGIYSLTPKYEDNFSASTKINTETIFSVWHSKGKSPFQGNNLNQWIAPRSINGYGFFYPTQSLIDNYEKSSVSDTTDPRMYYTVAGEGIPYYDLDYNSSWSTTGYISKKHIQPLTEVPTSTKGDGDLNYEAIRYADILLVEAEALNEQGKSAEALVPLNKVRKRARESYMNDESLPGYGKVPDGLLGDITTTDQTQLRDIIRRERRSELALEFMRFFDVMRYGSDYATKALSDKPNFNYQNNRFFPIPQSERDTNKKL